VNIKTPDPPRLTGPSLKLDIFETKVCRFARAVPLQCKLILKKWKKLQVRLWRGGWGNHPDLLARAPVFFYSTRGIISTTCILILIPEFYRHGEIVSHEGRQQVRQKLFRRGTMMDISRADEHPSISLLVPGVHQLVLVIDVDYTLFILHGFTIFPVSSMSPPIAHDDIHIVCHLLVLMY
jgi:hypothetical protein